MLEGLEINEMSLSDIKADNDEFRIDDGYYKKEYISIYRRISNYVLLNDITEMSDVSSNGCFKFVQDTLNDDYPKTVPYIRSGNVGNTFIEHDDLIKISQQAHSKLKLSRTKLFDVMMARKGKIGGASIITENETDFNCNENVIKLTIKDKNKYNPFYLTAFFNSKYGLKQIERLSTGNVQPWVSIYQIRKLRLAILPIDFQKEVERILTQANLKFVGFKQLYNEANEVLNRELHIKDFVPSNNRSNIKRYDSIFTEECRLDAEYYQSKYDDLFKFLSDFECETIGNIAEIKKSVEPGSEAYQDNGIPFIRVSDVTKFGISQPDIFLSESDYNLEDLRPCKDTILLSKDGSVGIAYKVDKDINCITSGALLHLKVLSKDFLPDYVTLVLNSQIVKMQAERDASGAIIQHWKPSEIENVIIPKLPMDIQTIIAQKVQKSFALQKECMDMLNCAKVMVEKEIEKYF